MISLRTSLMTFCALSTGVLVVLASSAFAQSAAPDPLAIVLPYEKSDVRSDPAARFGRLPNGMTYLIYKNATPPGTVAVHLRIGAGSLVESDAQRGLAHFVEHMAFNGSKNIAKDQLLPLMQRHGIKLGPDAGAYTLPNKTEYVLDLPVNDTESVDTALMIAREIAGNLLFQPDAVERERPVILGEERLRETPQVLAQTDWLKAAFPGQKFATRGNAIGLPEVIKGATPAELEDFYHANYRPDRATLVVVGDIDPDRIEAAIKAKFSDWQAAGPVRAADFGAYAPKGLKTYVSAGPSIADSLSATWFQPFDPRVQTRQKLDEDTEDLLLVKALNQRLGHESQQPDAAFTVALATQQNIYQTAKIVQISVLPKPGQDKAALSQALATLRQFEALGVTQAEMAPVLSEMDGFFKQQVAAGKTRDNEAIVSNFIENLDANSVFTSPEQDLADYERLAQSLTPEVLNRRLKILFAGDGPLLAHTAQDLAGVDGPALEALYKTASTGLPQPYAVEGVKTWPYTSFGTPKPPISHQDFPQVGFTTYVFANGLKVKLMPTHFKDDQVLVNVNFLGGLETFSPQTQAPIAFTNLYAAAGGVFNGGLGKLDIEQVQASLAGKTLSLTYTILEDGSQLGGTTTREDLATQLQMMMAYISDPAYRPAFFNQLHGILPAIYTQLNSAPQSVLQSRLGGLVHDHDNRFAFPTFDEANAITLDQVKGVLQASMTGKPVEITIVGDFDPAATLDVIANTFATLPDMPARPVMAPGGTQTAFPAHGGDVVLTHKGRPDQSISLLAWPVPGETADTQTSRGLEILTEILNQRAFDTVRQKLGQAYDAAATRQQSWIFRDFGLISVSGSIATGNDKAFVDAVDGLVDDLKAHPVSQDELDRARKPLLDRWQNDRKSNQHWARALPSASDGQSKVNDEAKQHDELLKVTPEMVQTLAQTYFLPSRVLHVAVLPEAAAAKAQ